MTLSFHALWMLCAIGVVVHAATAAPRVRYIAAFAVGFVAAAVVAGPQRLPDPAWVGVLSAGAAVVILFRPGFAVASAAWGGALGGILTALIEAQGLHPLAAVAAPALLAVMTMLLARGRSSFAHEVIRDEALLGVCLLGLVVAVVPGVTDGWQAATNLTIEPAALGPTTAVPAWTLALVGTSMVLGAVYSLWSRR